MAAVMVYIITIYLVEYIVYRIAKNKLSIAITVRVPEKRAAEHQLKVQKAIGEMTTHTPAVVGNH